MEKFRLEVQKILNSTQLWIEKQIENNKKEKVKKVYKLDFEFNLLAVVILILLFITAPKFFIGFAFGFLFAKLYEMPDKQVVAE